MGKLIRKLFNIIANRQPQKGCVCFACGRAVEYGFDTCEKCFDKMTKGIV